MNTPVSPDPAETGELRLPPSRTKWLFAAAAALVLLVVAGFVVASLGDDDTGNDEEDEIGGALKRALEIEILESRSASGVWAECKDAYESATQELQFEYLTDGATVGVDNPKYSGTLRVTNLRISPVAVGKVRTQVITVPIKAGTWTEATS